MEQRKWRSWLKQYRYVLLIVLVGVALLCLPSGTEEKPVSRQIPETVDVEEKLAKILSRIDGAGDVEVMLAEAVGEEIIYQTDNGGADTVIVADESRRQQGLIRTRESPVYQGAIVVCRGADSAAVRLAIVEAVSNVTGLGSDRITVLKMK